MSFIERFKIKREIKRLTKERKRTIRRIASSYELMLYTPRSQHAMIKKIISDYEAKDFPVWQKINRLEDLLRDNKALTH